MRKWLVLGVVVMVGAALFLSGWSAQSSRLTMAYQQQYWTKQTPKVMGPAWRVTSVKEISAPAGWQQTAGGAGIAVSFHAPGVTLQHPVAGPYHPGATLYLMPLSWEGECRSSGYDLSLTKKGYRDESQPSPVQFYPATYQGRTLRYHLFRSSIADGGLIDWARVEGMLGPRLRPPPKRPPTPRLPRP
jgi:hypothetical protein